MYSKLSRALLVGAVLVSIVSVRPRADQIAQTLPFSQNWSNINLITTANDWSGVPGIVGYRGDGMVGSTGVDPQTVLQDGSTTPVNVMVDGTTSPITPSSTTGGIAEFDTLANPVVAFQGSGTARAPHLVITVSTAGVTGIHVAYNLRDVDGTGDNTDEPVALQYRVGTTGNYTNVPAGFVPDASTGPNLATLVTPVSVTLPAAVDNKPVVQIRIITTDRASSDEWIGIDDILVTASGSAGTTNPTGTMTAAPSPLNVGDQITFTATVTPGTNPDDSNSLTVTGNLTGLGLGSPVFTRVGTSNTYTYTDNIPAGASGGVHSVTATIADHDTPPRTGMTQPATQVEIRQASAPTGIGTANPVGVRAGETTTLSVVVTPGTNPDSTGLAVSADLSSIGGSNAQLFQEGPNHTFSYGATVDPSTPLGAKTLPVVVSDAEGRSSATSLGLTVTPPLVPSTVVISQVYGGGGNASATYTNDYVQLYNRTSSAIDLTGWSLQYASAAGSSWTNRQPLGGSIPGGATYLIALAGGATGAALPAANITGSINMSQSAGKVALVDNGDFLSGPCPLGNPHLKDFVGYGSTATCHEGSGNAPGLNSSTAAVRLGGGFVDTDDNVSDFAAATPQPSTTAPIVEIGPAVLATDPFSDATTAPRDATIEVSFTEPVDVTGQWFHLDCATTGNHDEGTTAPGPGSRDIYFTPNVNFAPGETCTFTVFKEQVSDQDDDDSGANTDHIPADYTWSFKVVTGAAPPYPSSVHVTMGLPTPAVADVNHPDDYLMMKPEYALSYNRDLGRPNWVSWHLTPEWFGTLARVDTFRADPAVPPEWYRVESFSFQNSGFDRGHMTPNADRDLETSVPINQATYLMSNMVAQAPDNNQGPWADLEAYLRSLVGPDTDHTHPLAEAYVVSGPAGMGGTGDNGFANTIDNGRVTVPASTWKVALILPFGTDDVSRVTCQARTIAVIMPNVDGIFNNDWTQYLTTVDAVETLTGYDFFSNVPPTIQNCIQAGINGNNPDSQEITFAPIAAHVYGDAAFTIQASASSGMPVEFEVTSGPATVSASGLVHITGAGTVTIRASQPGGTVSTDAGDKPFAKAVPVEHSFVVDRAAAAFTNLSALTIELGTATTTLGGRIAFGALVPTGSVAITFNGATMSAPIGGDGSFAAAFPTAALAVAPGPYPAAFSYAGDGNFTDAAGSGSVFVVDTTAPAISAVSATPNVLGPPNHKMSDVALSYQATDLGGASCAVSVASNEPMNGTGDGNTAVDWHVVDARHVQLRAERAGGGAGRIYAVTVSCADPSGNHSTGLVTVSVPK